MTADETLHHIIDNKGKCYLECEGCCYYHDITFYDEGECTILQVGEEKTKVINPTYDDHMMVGAKYHLAIRNLEEILE
jgi:hypothetical protein